MDLSAAEQAIIAGDATALRAALSELCATDLDKIDDLLALSLQARAPCPDVGGNAAHFLASISASRQIAPLYGQAPRFPRHLIIGQDLDFLGEPDDHSAWTAAQWLNLLVLGQVSPRRRAAVVGTMRDDGIYVIEWVAYYFSLGFERVFIYTNDNADGSEHLLRRLAALDIITLIESQTSGMVRPGIKAFNHAVHLLHELRDYEWVLFVDSDEYFVPAPPFDHSIGNVLDALDRRYPDRSVGAIAYQWLWFNSAMVYERQPGILVERFQHATPHWLTKCLVRLRDVVSMRQQHFPELKAGRSIVDSAFEPLDPAHAWTPWPTQYSGGRINHYWPKSFEEFSLKKARGDSLRFPENEYLRDYSLFFEWNGMPTDETHHPFDPASLAKVQQKIKEFRSLDGMAAYEQEVERGFRRLVQRHDQSGGLRQMYDRLRP